MNCGSKEHLTHACPKPQLSREQRPCWKCGKPGHVGANCPTGGKGGGRGSVNSVQSEVSQVPSGVNACFMMDTTEPEHYERIIPFNTPIKTSRPVPRAICVDDFITKNSFAELADRATSRRAKRRSATVSATRSRDSKSLIKPFVDKCNNLNCKDADWNE